MAKNIVTLKLDDVDYTARPYAVCDTAGNVKDKVANFFGVGEKASKEKEPWYEKITRYGGAIFTGATILGALPHINNFIKEKIVPGKR